MQDYIEQLDAAIKACANEEVRAFLVQQRIKLENELAAKSEYQQT